MGSDAITILSTLFSYWFETLTSVKFPGTNFSIFSLLLVSLFAPLAIYLLRSLLGLGPGSDGQRGGNNGRIRVSKERRDDER